jgi:hypothetical protein
MSEWNESSEQNGLENFNLNIIQNHPNEIFILNKKLLKPTKTIITCKINSSSRSWGIEAKGICPSKVSMHFKM